MIKLKHKFQNNLNKPNNFQKQSKTVFKKKLKKKQQNKLIQ
jgi:hypothetical protein